MCYEIDFIEIYTRSVECLGMYAQQYKIVFI